MPVILRLILFFGGIVAIYYVLVGRTHKDAPIGGAFFFDMDNLVLNTGIPYAIPFDDIDFVELQYNSWELEHKLSYGLWVKVVRTNGKTKRVWYKGYRTAELALPSDMRDALEAKGLRVVMGDSNKK